MLIAYYLGFKNRKRKYFEGKMTATLKTYIDRHGPKLGCPRKWHFGIPQNTEVISGSAEFRGHPIRNHLWTLASFLTPLIFYFLKGFLRILFEITKNNSNINIRSRICLSFALYLFSTGNLDSSTKVHFSRLCFRRLRPVVFFISIFIAFEGKKRTHNAQFL